MRKYHTLLERDAKDAPWCIAFGDYDRETVIGERESYIDSGTRRANLKIITTGAAQKSIDAKVAELNGVQP